MTRPRVPASLDDFRERNARRDLAAHDALAHATERELRDRIAVLERDVRILRAELDHERSRGAPPLPAGSYRDARTGAPTEIRLESFNHKRRRRGK